MTARSVAERIDDVRRILAGAARVFDRRAALAPDLARTTGLSPEGVALGFESLERDATDEQLRSLVLRAGDARHVHVVLSANVFVAAARALSLARAAGARVTIRPSSREPGLARALVEATGDDRIALVDDRDVAATPADVLHVYGSDATIAAVTARARPGASVRGHGAGMGVALLSAAADLDAAAAALALDVAAFDQRGCLSPRAALVLGSPDRAATFAAALHLALARLEERVPRGTLGAGERAASTRWRDASAFAADSWLAPGHAVALAAAGASIDLPPVGRHVQVVPVADPGAAAARLAPLSRVVVCVGSDDEALAAGLSPRHARVSALGSMQRPPLDGPVDLRGEPDVSG